MRRGVRRHRASRLAAVAALVVALVAGVSVLPAAASGPAATPALSAAPAASGLPSTAPASCHPYPDVTAANPACQNIAWLKGTGITKPADGHYHPLASVTRGSMVAFLFRLTHPGTPQPRCATAPFPDVAVGSLFCGYISWAKRTHLVFGYPDGSYGPSRAVTRGAMAAYLHRIADPGHAAKACTQMPFSDVGIHDLFCGVITWLADTHLTFGIGGRVYGTDLPVTRQAMASFLHRLDTLMHSGSTTPSPDHRTPKQVLDGMTLQQQVGELLMMGNPATVATSATLSAIRDYHVGSVILTGRSDKGVTGTRAVVDRLQQATGDATAGTYLVVAADQEGGAVQVLQGPGFSRIPSALYQGTHSSLQTIRSDAAGWAEQWQRAGVTLDLAPVMDTVSESFAPQNAPIGFYDREFGYTPHDVLMRGNAFANGLRDADMGVTIKHFPGLGRVTGNTDTTAGVTDDVTTRTSASLQPFATGIDSGADAVMVSTAIYSKIAPGVPAAFSSTILRSMLRQQLGFTGVIVSDDLGAAAQVKAYSPGTRAVRFVQAGGDLVLTVDPSTVPDMYQALLDKARSDAAFRATVHDAALHVLRMKATLGALG